MASKEYIKEYFRKRAVAFPDFYKRRPLLPIEAHIVNQIPSGSNVLDLCCGGGETSLAIAKRGATVTGVDNVKEMCDLCKKLFAEEIYVGLFLVEDSTKLPFRDSCFSHVVCTGNSLNSMTNEDARRTMLEAVRVTKLGGILYFTILNPSSIRNLLAVTKGVFQRAPKWGFYYRSNYGLQTNRQRVPRGMSFLLTSAKVRGYLSEARLVCESSRWDIGLAASHLLLVCHKAEK